MPAPILVTKLFIPVTRPNCVPRSRLVAKLDKGLNCKLTLISAPAGFGKTTLVAQWLQSKGDDAWSPFCFAWLSLDEGDNDPVRFLTYFIAGLNRASGLETKIGDGALSMLQSPQPPPLDTTLTTLINDITSLPKTFVFVLDDYHVIEAQPVHAALSFLLENLPPQLHLVISTREDPLLPLSRLRVRRELTELRAAELRFTLSEAAEFLNQVMGLELSTDNIAALETRTEGWIAGLQLAAISLQGHTEPSKLIRSFTGSNRLVLDYLIEEVLDQQPVNIQRFLLKTAILTQLTGPLCDAVIEQKNSQQSLELLEKANLFIIPLDNERRWYRYHHLFADLLRQRLGLIYPEQVQSFHHNASVWYEQNGFVEESIEHALQIDDFKRVAGLIDKHIDDIWGRGEHSKLQRWLAELPEEILHRKPNLMIFQARCQYNSGQVDMAERTLHTAERGLDICTGDTSGALSNQPNSLSDPNRKKLLGRIAVTRAQIAFFHGNAPEIIQNSRRALEYLPEYDLAWRSSAAIALGDAHGIRGEFKDTYRARVDALGIAKTAGNLYAMMIASMKLAVTLRNLGQLEQVIEICEQQIEKASECGLSQTGVAGGFLAIWGEVLAERDDLEAALSRSRRGVELAECGDDMVILGWSYLCLMRVYLTRGDLAAAEQLVHRMAHNARESELPPWITRMMAAWQTRIWLAQDQLERASRWMVERGLDGGGELQFLSEIEQMVLARILIARGQLDEAIQKLQDLLEAAEQEDRISNAIEILILQALAYHTQRESAQAINTLEKALQLAKPGGFIRTFVDEGPPMARLLYDALQKKISPNYVQLLLVTFPDIEPKQVTSSSTQDSEHGWMEPLSERELDVLKLIAEGLTNLEIASRLYLSLNTVKSHTRSIYGKLGVNNRTQAVAKSRGFGILSGP